MIKRVVVERSGASRRPCSSFAAALVRWAHDGRQDEGARPRRVRQQQACASCSRRRPLSDLFRKARAYAERSADEWFVLSAMHGLVDPGDVVEPYDLTLNTMDVAERSGRHAARQPVWVSGLWNVRHVGEGVDAEFVAQFAELVDGNGNLGRVAKPPAVTARARVRALEGDAMDQVGRPHEGSEMTPGGRPSAAAFRSVLGKVLEEATQSGAAFVDVTSADLHRRVGGYPGPLHAMPTCCSVLRAAMTSVDTVVAAPPNGIGTSLATRYALPR